MNDAIRRQDVIECIKGYIHEIITESGVDKNAHTNKVLRELAESIEKMPAVQPETKTGKWVFHRNDLSTLYRWECDKCRKFSKTDFNYCPNCGADMRGKRNEFG